MSNPADLNHHTTATNDAATSDPFAKHREAGDNPFAESTTEKGRSLSSGDANMTQVPLAQRDRRLSKEWDAAQTPPSRFQRPPHSIFATPASRDGHIARNKIHGFKEKVKELSGKKDHN